MARNIEIKARVGSVSALAEKLNPMATEAPCTIFQDDTFFTCDNGRLKLRVFAPGSGQLIFYQRQDTQGPKESFYVLSETSSPDSLREALSLAYGVAGRVRKNRLLYLVGRTRVHLDAVEGLGQFMELEVVLKDDETAEAGVQEAELLMQRLGIHPSQLIEGAYVDLLNGRRS
ncbi:MAG TPA: class IV adenylate cyclase [Noviherbaspirillum sp.]|uniref:class IV adenylate cyclase n=1 Tax=Noviherbaspirillum sp. TaxID=1926288 RepID=UPI002D6BAA89|nr:class IV adenylate cyclase [Noviherbaspirillum sp.]HYD97237.1 class IV adenylate cyclase [Noviherbaspirillum sp.]